MKVLMVCLGNICRSPLAEGLFAKKVMEAGLSDKIKVSSCGTSGYHNGEPPDERSQENALQNGLDISHLRSSQFQISDFETQDKIYVMDQSNYNDVKKLCPDPELMNKVDLFLNLINPGENQKVPDPYFGGAGGFQEVYDLVDAASDKLLQLLKKEL